MCIRKTLSILGAILVTYLIGYSSHPSAMAGGPEDDVPTISTADLRAKLDGGEEITLINVMPKIIHDGLHIPGSVNIPVGQVKTSAKMPEDKERLLVFYCMGVM